MMDPMDEARLRLESDVDFAKFVPWLLEWTK